MRVLIACEESQTEGYGRTMGIKIEKEKKNNDIN